MILSVLLSRLEVMAIQNLETVSAHHQAEIVTFLPIKESRRGLLEGALYGLMGPVARVHEAYSRLEAEEPEAGVAIRYITKEVGFGIVGLVNLPLAAGAKALDMIRTVRSKDSS